MPQPASSRTWPADVRPILVAAMAFLVPPAWVALRGGADVDVAGLRLEFYDAMGAPLALAGCLVVAALPRSGRAQQVLAGLATLAFLGAAFTCWTPGINTEAFRMRSPDRAAQVGWVFLAVAWALGRGRLAPSRATRTAGIGLVAGAVACAAVLAADRHDLDQRIREAGATATGPDVIVLLIDTLRADALGAYGASPSPSPFLDSFAEGAAVFERALSQAPWTAPSVSSLLSSLYPSSFLMNHTLVGGKRFIQLPAGMPWLPEQMQEAGYHTAAFVKNPLLQGGTRFERGFDVHEWVRGATAEFSAGQQLVDAVLVWGDAIADHRADGGEGSFFLYAHFMDPHTQYRPPDEFLPEDDYEGEMDGGVRSLKKMDKRKGGPAPEDLAHVRALYRAEVAYLDTELARLQEGLARRGLWTDQTIVALIADHGEQFWEHGKFMHGDLNLENVHVPLIVRGPGIPAHRVPEPVALLDLAPTLLDWLDIERPEAMEGRSLASRLRGDAAEARLVLSQKMGGHPTFRVTGPGGALLADGDSRSFEDPTGVVTPTEAAPTGANLPALEAALAEFRSREHDFLSRQLEDQILDPDDDTEARLRALGYLE